MPQVARTKLSSRDRGASDGRVAMLVTVCLIVLAIPGAFVLHEMLLPKLPSVGPIAGTSPLPIGSAPIVDSPGISSPPPAASSSPVAAPPTSPAPSIAAAPPSPAASASLLSLDDAVPAVPGYTVSVAPGGRVLDGVTSLDLCQIKFTSESKRVARLEVMYADVNGSGPSLEVVRYGPGGAALAYNELINGVKRCPQSYHEANVYVTKFQVEPLDDSLLPSQLSIVQSATISGVVVWSSAVFQFDGPYLVIAYSNPYTTQTGARAAALELGRLAAVQLQRGLAGSSQPILSG